jgi:hypothetical protein
MHSPSSNSTTSRTVFAMVKAGFGIIALPLCPLSALPFKSFAGRELSEPDNTCVVDVARLRDCSLSPAAEFVQRVS